MYWIVLYCIINYPLTAFTTQYFFHWHMVLASHLKWYSGTSPAPIRANQFCSLAATLHSLMQDALGHSFERTWPHLSNVPLPTERLRQRNILHCDLGFAWKVMLSPYLPDKNCPLLGAKECKFYFFAPRSRLFLPGFPVYSFCS